MRSEAINLTADPLEARFGVVSKQLANCAEHGDYAAITIKRSTTASGCPACAEIRQRASDLEAQSALTAKIASDRLQAKLGNALIPRRFADKTFEQYIAKTPQQQKALATCREYAENFDAHHAAGRCLLLLGKPGTGKTHLASAIACAVIRSGRFTAVYRTVGGILQYVKGSYGNHAEYTEADAFTSLTKPGLLIIDEVGATKPTEFEQATLFAIINGRYEDQRPTIVVSNLMPAELPPVLGERSVDRLREGGGIALVFDWQSARRAAV